LVILCIIALLAIFRLLQALVKGRSMLPTVAEACRPVSNPSNPLVIEYATPMAGFRQRGRVADALYLAMVIACYLLAFFAQSIMPGGYSWNYDWELANFLMTVAALSSVILFAVGLFGVLLIGRRRVTIPILFGTWMAGVLPVLMFLFSKRWLQGNFA